jgi:hypothetical protein
MLISREAPGVAHFDRTADFLEAARRDEREVARRQIATLGKPAS